MRPPMGRGGGRGFGGRGGGGFGGRGGGGGRGFGGGTTSNHSLCCAPDFDMSTSVRWITDAGSDSKVELTTAIWACAWFSSDFPVICCCDTHPKYISDNCRPRRRAGRLRAAQQRGGGGHFPAPLRRRGRVQADQREDPVLQRAHLPRKHHPGATLACLLQPWGFRQVAGIKLAYHCSMPWPKLS